VTIGRTYIEGVSERGAEKAHSGPNREEQLEKTA
jgi:hypothetical protein